MKYTTDVAIIGGGIIGCAIAYHLSKYGIRVSILEKGELGEQASNAAAGLLAPLGPLSGSGPYADLLLASFSQFPRLVPELEDACGIRLEYDQLGSLRTVRNLKRVSHLRKRMEEWKTLGLQMYWLSGEEARQQEPLLAPDVCAAIYVPEESQIKASQLVHAFSRASRNLGAQIHTHTHVVSIQKDSENIYTLQTASHDILNCQHLIIATGAWSACYEHWLNLTLPVSPLKGQMLALQAPTPTMKHIVFGEAAYFAPRGDHILVGATKENAGFNTDVTEEAMTKLSTTATRFLPILQQSTKLASWAGLRPSTPDKAPILGKVPGWQNLTLAIGHNSIGILLSIITGQSIAKLITTGETPEIIRPFTVERFQREVYCKHDD